MFAALIRTDCWAALGLLTQVSEKKLCILGLYKFKHRMTCNRGLLTIKGRLNLFVCLGVIDGVFTTDENE